VLGEDTEGFKSSTAMAARMSGRVLEARKLVKSFGTNRVLKGVDLNIEQGDRYFLFGPNGAGKTTLVKVLSGLWKADSGEVLLFGKAMENDPLGIRARIGVLSHDPYLYGELSALENLEFFGQLYNVHDPGRRAKEMLKEVGLYGRAHDRVHTFSRGMKQRLGLARALVHDPDLVFLDEPYTGLDMRASAILERMVREKSEAGKAFLAITHDLGQGLEMATRAGILSGGKMSNEADPEGWDQFTDDYLEVMGGGR
jgi:heme ABC exporter ATP-binding subunit CcmA